jgi:hypothetical protein
MSATSMQDNRSACTCPCRLSDRDSGPASALASASHAWSVRTGRVSGFEPEGIPIFAARAVLIGLASAAALKLDPQHSGRSG